jgi:hypothetical protein
LIRAALGDKDKAFEELEKSFAEHDCYLPRGGRSSIHDPLRDDRRFKDLMKRIVLNQ